MDLPPSKIPEVGFFRLVWAQLNKTNEYLRQSRSIGGRNILQRRTLNGTLTVAEPQASGGGGSSVTNYRLKEVGADWLRCREYDGTTEGSTDLYIARDPELRRSPFDGQTIAYSSDGDSFSAGYSYTSHTKRIKTINGIAETQVIVPYYKADVSVIIATETTNKTGVLDANGNDISMVELTQRAWAKLET